MTGTSPPGPFRCGSTTCSVKAVATAASNALPPFSNIPMPTAVAIQCVVVHHAERAFDLRPRGEGVWIDIGHIRSLVAFRHACFQAWRRASCRLRCPLRWQWPALRDCRPECTGPRAPRPERRSADVAKCTRETLKVGLAGLGAVGLDVARRLEAGIPGLALAAVSARDHDKARRNLPDAGEPHPDRRAPKRWRKLATSSSNVCRRKCSVAWRHRRSSAAGFSCRSASASFWKTGIWWSAPRRTARAFWCRPARCSASTRCAPPPRATSTRSP